MRNSDIYNIVVSFRSAIMEAKYDGKFKGNDRMRGFPRGCCDDASDLLAYYLYNTYGIYTQQGNGIYRDDNPYNTTNHAWLVMENKTVIDITGSQFETCAGFTEEVYVGKEKLFYKKLERRQIGRNCDITKDDRLWNDYKIVMSYISEE